MSLNTRDLGQADGPLQGPAHVFLNLLERHTRIQRRERELEKVARQVEADDVLNEEMNEWDTTVADGIDDHVPAYVETR